MDEDIETQHTKPIDTPPEEFYNQPDSIYVRLQYFEDTDRFRLEVKNEILAKYSTEEELPAHIMALCAFVRGMLEVSINRASLVTSVGVQAINAENMILARDGMSPEQKILLDTETKGSA